MKAAEKKARELFERAVLAKSPLCVMRDPHGHDRCDGPLDAHHVIPKQRLRSLHPIHLFKPNDPAVTDRAEVEQRRMELVWDARNGVPVCRKHHGLLTSHARKLLPTQIYPEVVAFAAERRLDHLLSRLIHEEDVDADADK